jgi:hypothetical protein
LPAANPVIILVLEEPEIPPGLITQFPDGKPLN